MSACVYRDRGKEQLIPLSLPAQLFTSNRRTCNRELKKHVFLLLGFCAHTNRERERETEGDTGRGNERDTERKLGEIKAIARCMFSK